jgi:hypothetical protein
MLAKPVELIQFRHLFIRPTHRPAKQLLLLLLEATSSLQVFSRQFTPHTPTTSSSQFVGSHNGRSGGG